jgi:hypothetical protein
MLMYLRKSLFIVAAAAMLVFALAACAETETEQEEAPDGEQTSAEQTMTEDTAMTTETTMMEDTGGTVGAGEVTVGGFVVESPGVPAREVPEVATNPEAVNEYLGEVRPVIDGTVRDITGLVNPEVQVGEDGVTLDLNLNSLEEARQSVEDGAAELQEIQPPEDLQPINDRLVESYEEALPAYQNMAEAAQNGDPEQFATATQESLPQIQAFNTEVNAIIEDLEQASGSGS